MLNKILGSPSDWDLKRKAIYTVAVLLVYRIGVAIPVPYVDSELFKTMTESSAAGNLFTMMTLIGGSLGALGVMSLGVMPYITASIMMQLLKVIIPKVENMHRSDEGQKKLSQISRYLTIPLAVVQAMGIVVGAPYIFGFRVFTTTSFGVQALAVFVLTVGALATMRLGESITIKGIGNGASLLIFLSILTNLPSLFIQSWTSAAILGVVVFALALLGVFALVAFVEKSEYRIPVIYTTAPTRRSAKTSSLPVKVALTGVLPVIFSASVMSLPQFLSQMFNVEWLTQLNVFLSPGSILYTVVFIGLTVAFTFFSIMLTFDVKKVSSDIRTQGGFVEHKKPGKPTEDYINSIANKVSVLGAVYLSVICLVTIYVFPLAGLPVNSIGATSIIILSTVVITVGAAVEAEMSTLGTVGFLDEISPKSRKRSFGRSEKNSDIVSRISRKHGESMKNGETSLPFTDNRKKTKDRVGSSQKI